MATVDKAFRVKNSLVVEGTSATVNGVDVLTTTATQTISNKTISGTNNTISNIGNSSLTNSSVTINGSSVSLGGSQTITAANPNALTIGTGLSGTSYNGSTAVTIAIDSTVATLTGTQTLTNKTLTSPVIGSIVNTGTLTLPTSTDTLVARATTDTLTNKSISGSTNTLSNIPNNALTNSAITVNGTSISLGGSQTITAANPNALTIGTGLSGTSYSGSAAVTIAIDSTVATLTGTQTLTNKTLTSPVIGTIVNTGTLTLPTSTDTLVGRATTDTLTNKTLTSPVISTIVNSGTLTLPTSTDTLVGRATTDTLTNKTLGSGTTLGANLAAGSNRITGLADPSGAQDAATKAYVDSVAQGLDVKASVRAATTSAGTLSTSFANNSVVDGVTLVTGDRILIKNQATTSENGIYVVASSGAPTRATDMNTGTQFPGAFTFVEEGTTNGDTGWVCTTNNPITVGTTAITFAQFSGSGSYSAGDGLSLTGNVFAVDSTVARLTATQTLTNKSMSGSSNTFTNIPNNALTNSSITVNGTAISLGGSQTITAANPNALTIGTGLSGTSYNGSSAVTIAIDSTVATLTGTQTLTNKTLTSPVISSIVNTGTLTLPITTDTLVGRATTDTLTNKSISGSTNTLSNIPNGALTNSSITVNGTSISLGGSQTITAANPNALTIGTGLSGTSYNGSTAVTIANTGVLSITGTANQVVASASTGAVTLSLPQSIATTSDVTFNGLTVGSVTLTDALIGTATTSISTTSATVVDSWSGTTYKSAKYIVQMRNGTDIEVLEVLVTLDGNNNVYITEYADVQSNAQIGTTDADYTGGNVRLLVTSTNGTTVKVHKTLIEA